MRMIIKIIVMNTRVRTYIIQAYPLSQLHPQNHIDEDDDGEEDEIDEDGENDEDDDD